MAEAVLDRKGGAALVLFVATQVTYLIVQMAVMSPPGLSFHEVGELAAFVRRSAVPLRSHTLIALAAFVFFFVPGAIGLRRRLERTSPEGSPWPDLVGAATLLVMIAVFMGSVSYAVLAVPGDPLSSSVLRATLMDNSYSILVVGNFPVALFIGAASLAVMRSQRPSRWLGWWGLATAAASLVAALWIVSADLDGSLYGLGLLARASFLAWLLATGVWMIRSRPAATDQPARQTPS